MGFLLVPDKVDRLRDAVAGAEALCICEDLVAVGHWLHGVRR